MKTKEHYGTAAFPGVQTSNILMMNYAELWSITLTYESLRDKSNNLGFVTSKGLDHSGHKLSLIIVSLNG